MNLGHVASFGPNSAQTADTYTMNVQQEIHDRGGRHQCSASKINRLSVASAPRAAAAAVTAVVANVGFDPSCTKASLACVRLTIASNLLKVLTTPLGSDVGDTVGSELDGRVELGDNVGLGNDVRLDNRTRFGLDNHVRLDDRAWLGLDDHVRLDDRARLGLDDAVGDSA